MQPAFTVPVRVVFRDVDSLGHVNNAVYFTYLETVRIRHLMKLTGRRSLWEFGIILARATCNYRSPASFDETLTVSLWPTAIGRSSWTYQYEVREKRTGRLVADAETVQVAYDYRRGASIPLPQTLRRQLEKLMTVTRRRASDKSTEPLSVT